MIRKILAVLAVILGCAPLCIPGAALAQTDRHVPTIDSGNTAWLLVSSALVMLMTPGLAFFYAGMVSRKNVVSTLLQNFVALAVVGLIWVVVGYSLVFTESQQLHRRPRQCHAGWPAEHHLRRRQRAELCLRGLPDDVRHHHARR